MSEKKPDVIVIEDKKKRTKSKDAGSKKRGRPVENKYFDRPVVINYVVHLIKEGKSDNEIARLVNVPKSSFYRWKEKHLELWESAVLNSDPIKSVERSLIKRANGFWVERPIYDANGQLIDTEFRYFPPSEAAAQYFLNNRDPQNWKSKVEHNHALEELPLAVNFVLDEPKKLDAPEPDISKIAEAFGDALKSIATLDGNEDTGSNQS